MPSYDYRCRTCDTSFEVQRSITVTEASRPICPQGHAETIRVFTPVAVGGSAPATSSGCCGGGCCG